MSHVSHCHETRHSKSSVLSRFLNCASEMHMKAAKRVIRYVKGTLNYGVRFRKSQNFKLQGYSDSDWGLGQMMSCKALQVIVLTLVLDVFHGAQEAR